MAAALLKLQLIPFLQRKVDIGAVRADVAAISAPFPVHGVPEGLVLRLPKVVVDEHLLGAKAAAHECANAEQHAHNGAEDLAAGLILGQLLNLGALAAGGGATFHQLVLALLREAPAVHGILTFVALPLTAGEALLVLPLDECALLSGIGAHVFALAKAHLARPAAGVQQLQLAFDRIAVHVVGQGAVTALPVAAGLALLVLPGGVRYPVANGVGILLVVGADIRAKAAGVLAVFEDGVHGFQGVTPLAHGQLAAESVPLLASVALLIHKGVVILTHRLAIAVHQLKPFVAFEAVARFSAGGFRHAFLAPVANRAGFAFVIALFATEGLHAPQALPSVTILANVACVVAVARADAGLPTVGGATAPVAFVVVS